MAGLTADSVKAVDPETVLITLPKTASPGAFLAVLTNTIAGVVDSKEVKTHETGGDNGSAWLLDHSAGSGAYVVDHWTKDVEVLLTANPNFNGAKPALSSVLISHVPELANQLTALQKGDADIALNLTAEQLATLSGDATSVKGEDLRLFYLGMNVAVNRWIKWKCARRCAWPLTTMASSTTCSRAMPRRCRPSSPPHCLATTVMRPSSRMWRAPRPCSKKPESAT